MVLEVRQMLHTHDTAEGNNEGYCIVQVLGIIVPYKSL